MEDKHIRTYRTEKSYRHYELKMTQICACVFFFLAGEGCYSLVIMVPYNDNRLFGNIIHWIRHQYFQHINDIPLPKMLIPKCI